MKKIYLLLVFLCLFYYAQAQQFSLVHGGITRTYILHLPTGYTATAKYPLVFNFHGLTSNAQQQQYYTGMDAVSNANKFIVVYPNGVNNTWNLASGSGTDDIGFVNALIDALITKYSINTERVYATGFSMGGFFSYRVGCKLSNRIAAIASVSGNMTGASTCTPVRNLPVMHIHGTSDGIVSYNGVQPSLNYWINKNKCTAPAQTTRIAGTNTDLIIFGGCSDGVEVRHYKINGGGHTWSRGSATTINASQEIWNFFSRFTLTPPSSKPAPVDNITATSDNPELAESGNKVILYPNPAKDNLRVSFLSPVSTDVTMSIRDLIQKTILDLKTQASVGENTIEVNISKLHEGLHIVVIAYGDQRITKKVYVLK